MITSALKAINFFPTIARTCLLYLVSSVNSPTIPFPEGDWCNFVNQQYALVTSSGHLEPAFPLTNS